MAALDIRHLSAPFSNKLNLIVIISIVVLFAIFRLSVSEKAAVSERVPQRVIEPIINEVPAPQPKPGSANLLDELLQDTKKAPIPVEKRETDGAPFKDIEAALGIGN